MRRSRDMTLAGASRWRGRALATCVVLLASVLPLPDSAHGVIVGWENIGPAGLRVSSIAVPPSCPDTILAAINESEYPFLMRTTDGGASWEAVDDITGGLGDLTFDGSDPMVAYAAGGRIYRSLDAGAHWTPVSGNIHPQCVVVDPYEARRIFVGTGWPRDVHFSPDRGESWIRIGIDPGAPDQSLVSDIATDPSDTNLVYAGSAVWFTDADVPIWRTTDFGESWTGMGPFGEPPTQMTEAQQLYMDPEDPGFILAGAGRRGSGPFYLTADGGVSWLCARVGIEDEGIGDLMIPCLEPWPTNSRTLVATAYGDYPPRCVYVSFNRGGAWQPLVCDLDIWQTTHAAIDASGRVLYSTRYGIKRSIHDGSPDLVVVAKAVNDSAGGNGNGIPEAGETFSLTLTIQNRGDRASATEGTITCDDVFVEILTSTSGFGSLEFGERGESDSPYEIRISPEREDGPIRLTLHVSSGSHDFDCSFYLGARVAVLDDDNNRPYDGDLLEALDANLIGYDVIPTVAYQPITYEAISGYRAIVWTTGDSRRNTISEAEEEILMQYLDAGGALYLNSQDYLYDAGDGMNGVLTDFGRLYLHLVGYLSDIAPTGVLGVDGDAVSDGMYADPLDYPFTNRSDAIFADSLASIIFRSAPSGIMGNSLRYPKEVGAETYRLVFTSFPFEAFPKEGEDPNNQRTLIRRIMEWLVPDGGLVPTGVPAASGADVAAYDLRVASLPNPQTHSAKLVLTSGPRGCSPEIAVYAVDGRLIRELAGQAFQGDGAVSVTWDGCDSDGRRVASGIYFVKVKAGEEEATTRITLLR